VDFAIYFTKLDDAHLTSLVSSSSSFALWLTWKKRCFKFNGSFIYSKGLDF